VTHAPLRAYRMRRDVLSRHAARHTTARRSRDAPSPLLARPSRTRLLDPASAPLHATAQQKTCAPNKTQNGQPRARTVVHATHTCAHRRGNAHPAGTRHRHTPCARGTRRTTRNRTNCFAWPTRRTPYPAAASRPRGGPAVHREAQRGAQSAYGELAPQRSFHKGQGNFLMAYNSARIPGSRLTTRTELNKWESWGNPLASLPKTIRVQIHYDKINEFGTRYGHAVSG
jgi:hypothetical protein